MCNFTYWVAIFITLIAKQYIRNIFSPNCDGTQELPEVNQKKESRLVVGNMVTRQ